MLSSQEALGRGGERPSRRLPRASWLLIRANDSSSFCACILRVHLAHFDQAKELVHLIVEAGRPNLALQRPNKHSGVSICSAEEAEPSATLRSPLTLSSTISMEKSFPLPRELLHVLMLLLLVMRARIVHLSNTEDDELICILFFFFFIRQKMKVPSLQSTEKKTGHRHNLEKKMFSPELCNVCCVENHFKFLL